MPRCVGNHGCLPSFLWNGPLKFSDLSYGANAEENGRGALNASRLRPGNQMEFCSSTMYKRASSFLEGSEGFFRRNGRKYFDVVEWIFRLGR